MDLTTGEEITRGRVAPFPLTDTVKNAVEAVGVNQGMTSLKFTNKKGQTLAHQDWIAGVDCDTIMDDSGGTEDTQMQNDEAHKNDPVEIPVHEANPVAGSLVEKEEEAPDADEDMEEVIDKMIDELSDEVIPRGEAALEEVLNEKDESDDSTEEPVERPLRPTREKWEPVRLAHSQTLEGKTPEK